MKVEFTALLQSTEGAGQPGSEPEQERNAPAQVRRQQAVQRRTIQRTLERPAAEEHAGQADCEGQQMERRYDGGEHGRVPLVLAIAAGMRIDGAAGKNI